MFRIIILFFLVFLSVDFSFASVVFRQLNQGLRDFDISSLAVCRANPNLAYVGSSKAIYKTEDGGRNWKAVLSLWGINKRVNFLTFNRKEPSLIYAATNNGLFKLKDADSNVWEKLFSGVGEKERKCSFILADANNLFLGTEYGLFISQDSGKNWQKAKGELGRLHISSIDSQGEKVFVAAGNNLFVSMDFGKNWQKIFSLGLEELESEDGVDSDLDTQAVQDVAKISYVFVDNDKLYLAGSSGLFVSLDSGASFRQVCSTGLPDALINNIEVCSANLYISTSRGVFVLQKNSQNWQNLYQGLYSSDVRFISFDTLGRLWLATDKGVYRTQAAYNNELASSTKETGLDKFDNWRVFFKDEPTISEVQLAAIKYAEVIAPQKIRDLRRGARLKALVPDIDLDYDRTINYDSGSDNFYIGPQDWSLGLSWDLGDLIWSEQQRLIDSQVRLMVELRDDILTEVTRLYFERRRLQLELLISPPQEPKAKLEKELRLEELTASIDALTGGYLSRQLGLQ